MDEPRSVALHSAVVIGTGLIGTSVALALRRSGVRVYLLDRDDANARAAARRGGGIVGRPRVPADIAVVAVPPGRIAEVVAEAQAQQLARAYTDVGSVKAAVLAQLRSRACDLTCYVGSHPMAGGERSGPQAASADLFHDRAWVLTPLPETSDAALRCARRLVALTGARPVFMAADEHDHAVAHTSHVPHVVASVLAASLAGADQSVLALCGPGIRDATRIAAGNVALWTDILLANATQVAMDLHQIAEDLDKAADTIDSGSPEIAAILSRGNAGRDSLMAASAISGSSILPHPVAAESTGGSRPDIRTPSRLN